MHRSSNVVVLQPKHSIPAPRIGIIGGGQLAKMTAMAAVQFGCEIVVLERKDDFPAHSLDTHAIVGDWNDPALVLQLGSLTDVVMLENEIVNTEVLKALTADGHKLWPSAEMMSLVQDKLRQKETFVKAGIPLPRYADAPTQESLRAFGFPAVLKKRRDSYDGKGNATVQTAADVAAAWEQLRGDENALYVEEFCSFCMELAVIVTRGQTGEIVSYPVVETINREHICHIVKAPAAVPADIAAEATSIALKAIESIGGVGSFGVELFLLADGRIVLNEIAPRVHNTGHYTIEACLCSQFENHVRAVLGWPLGSSQMIVPAACMVNLLGYAEGSGVPQGLSDALAVTGTHIHVYGKTRSVRGRKMGHITALGETMDEAFARAQKAADFIRFGDEA